MALLTVVGASGNSVQVTVDGADKSALVKQAQGLASQLGSELSSLDVRNLAAGSSTFSGNQAGYGAITASGAYSVGGNVQWLAVGSDATTQAGTALAGWVNLDATKGTANNLTVLAGTNAGVNFRAGSQSGTFLGGSGDNFFQGSNLNNAGDWKISVGDGNNVINSGNGNNTITSGLGDNTITLGKGFNQVHSNGQDTITASTGTQNITLSGASSTVNVGDNSLVVDTASNQQITVGGSSTVVGGSQDLVTLAGTTGTVTGGELSTISAAQGDFMVANAKNADVNIIGNLTFKNGTGETTITAGQSTIYGAEGLDAHVNATSANSLFIATTGNQTLDGASSIYGIHAYGADSGTTAQTFIGGSGASAADTLVAGTGNATLTGGSGAANVFGFRNGVAGADYTITDFGSAAGNSVLLVHYDAAYLNNGQGYTKDNFQKVLDAATHQNGNTTITLSDNSKITFVGVDSLNVNQFSGF
ncbi:beta strand repeat-containing protein [Acetobacter sp.]|uniref:beta strand repeat-containing protein n=1 Tax=Acetobacter sp. TaxID=440 RepID=UPI0039EA9B21